MEKISAIDEKYMRRCLFLARCGAGSTSPNPMVGAVIVCDGRIIGEGYHIRAGEPHAEVNAVNSVSANDKHLLERSTMYVSLEPCSHYGKTPPCADLIIACKIPRVVVGVTDCNVQVNGGGIARMRAEGIEVVVDVLRDEALDVNKIFFTNCAKKRPWITLKWAESADGYIDALRSDASCGAAKISNPVSQVAVHKERARHDAILVGTRCALLDNPSLDTRFWGGRSPLRLVIDREGVLPVTHRLFDGEHPTVVYTASASAEKEGKNIQQIELDFTSDVLLQIVSHLHSIKVSSLLVEGGAQLLQSFIDASLWDAARVERNLSLLLGDGVKSPVLSAASCVENTMIAGNEITLYVPKKPL